MKSATEIWFDKLQDLWTQKRINEIGSLAANQFVYYENPFEKPVTNVADLIEVWGEVKNKNIKILEIDCLGCADSVRFAKYHFVAEIDEKSTNLKVLIL